MAYADRDIYKLNSGVKICIDDLEDNKKKDTTVASVCNTWLINSSHRWKTSTKCRYEEKVRIYIRPFFGDKNISEITTAEIEEFISMIITSGMPGRSPVSPGTARGVLSVLKQIRLYAIKMEIPVRYSTESILIRSHKPDISVFSEEDEKKLIARLTKNTDETDAGFLTCLFTGIRIGELCALKYDNIDLDNGVIHIRQTMQRLPINNENHRTHVVIDSPKSDSSVRDIPINKELSGILRRFYKPGAYLLTGDKKRFVEPRTMENRFKKLLKECGLAPAGVHSCRHSFSCRCIERGMDPKTLAELLGHANVATTLNTYVHSNINLKKDGINALSDLLSD